MTHSDPLRAAGFLVAEYAQLAEYNCSANAYGQQYGVLLLDTDLVVVGSVDAIFQGPTLAAVMRGTGDWLPEQPRPKESYFQEPETGGGHQWRSCASSARCRRA